MSHAGTRRVHVPSVEVIGNMEQLDQLKWSVIGNGRSLDLFKWRGIYNKCQKKVVKGAWMFFVDICVGCGQYPSCQIVWCGGCYVKHLKDDLPDSGKEYGGDWQGELYGRYEKVRTGNHMLTYFKCDL